MRIPELDEEIDRLRIRKSELEDIIAHAESTGGQNVDPAKVVELFRYSVEHFDPDHMREIIQYHITRIYANVDGSFSVNVGVLLNGKYYAT